MDNFNAKEYSKKFWFGHLVLTVTAYFFIVVGIFLGVYFNNAAYQWISVGALAFVHFVVRKHNFAHLLTQDFEPCHYADVLAESGIVSKHGVEQLNAAYYTGDLQRTVDLCVRGLKNKKLRKVQYWYYVFLARSYFALGDKEALGEVCRAYEAALSKDEKGEKTRNALTVMRFFALYAEGDLEGCEAHYRNMPLPVMKNERDRIFSRLGVDFNLAVVAYERGDSLRAKRLFETVISAAPNMVQAVLAKKYLAAMEKGEVVTHEKLLPSESFIYSSQKKRVRRQIISVTAFLASIIVAITLAVAIKPTVPQIFKGLTPDTTRAEIVEMYGEILNPEAYNTNAYGFLGVNGYISASCVRGEDVINQVTWAIYAEDFESESEYRRAVEKVLRHFDRVFTHKDFRYSENEMMETYSWQSKGMVYYVNLLDADGEAAYFTAMPQYIIDELYEQS